MFKESGFFPQPEASETTIPTPEKKDVFSGIKKELRRLLPRVLMLTTTVSCGDKEDRQVKEFISQQQQEMVERPEHASSDTTDSTTSIAVVDTASGQTMPQEIKTFLDQSFDTPTESMVIVPHLEKTDEPTVLHTHASEHHDLRAAHHHDADNKLTQPIAQEVPNHIHEIGTDKTSPHEHLGVSGHLGLTPDIHLNGHHHETNQTPIHGATEHDHQSGHGHFDVLTGGTITNALGETATEILDLHGHTSFHMADANGVWNIGLGKSTRRFSGHDDIHASFGATFDEPIYGYVTPGAEVEVGSEGANLTFSVTSVEKDGSQWWAGVAAAQSEHEGGHGEHDEHTSHDDDHNDLTTQRIPEQQPPVTFDLTPSGSSEDHDEHSATEFEAAQEILERFNMGLRGKLSGNVSVTGGMEHGGWYSRFDLPIKVEGRNVNLSLLTRMELAGHDAGKENAGVFFRIKGEL